MPGSGGSDGLRRGYTRADFLRVGGGAVAGVLAAGMAGCAGGSEEARLRMTWWGEQGRHRRTQEALRVFRKRNPGIEISAELSGGDGYFEKLVTQATGGNAPDVFQSEPNQFAELSQRGGILLELDRYVPDLLAVGGWPEETLDLNRVGGELLGVPLGLNSFMFIYDRAAFARAGAGDADEGWTWEDFERIATDVSRASEEGYFGTEDTSGDGYVLEVWVRQRGRELFTEDGRLGFEKSDLADWWEYWDRLRQSGAAVPAEVQALSTGDVTETPLVTGKAAAEFDFSNRLIAFSGLVDGELGHNVLPNGPPGSRYGMYLRPALTMCAYARGEYPEDATRIINALVNVPEVARPLGMERGVSPSPEIREMLLPDLGQMEREIVAYVERVAEEQIPMTIQRPVDVGEVLADTGSLLERTSQDIAFGRASVDESVDRFFEEAGRILS